LIGVKDDDMPLRVRAWRVVAVCVCLCAAVACSAGDDKAAPSATLGTEPPRTTTTDPYAVPDVIDVAYVNRVLAGLDQITGDVVRLVVRSKTFPREAFDRLRALYASDAGVQRELDLYHRDMERNFSGYRENPGNKTTSVTELITGSRSCIFARVERNFSAVGVNAVTAGVQWVAIQPLDQSRDPNRYNYTGWAYRYEGFSEQRTEPENPCTRE
jgi:hypothetical protein